MAEWVDLGPVTQGNDYTLSLTFQKDDGTARDITNWVIWLTIKTDEGVSDANAEVQKKVTNHTSPQQGQTEVTLSPTETEAISQGRYVYDLQIKTDVPQTRTPMRGNIVFEKDVTEEDS